MTACDQASGDRPKQIPAASPASMRWIGRACRELAHDYGIDQQAGSRGKNGRHQIGPIGQGAQRQELEKPGQEQVERIPRRMRDAPGGGRGDQVATVGAAVGPGQAGRKGAEIDGKKQGSPSKKGGKKERQSFNENSPLDKNR